MALNPRIWHPIAVVLCAANLAGVWFAARPAEPWHATLHAVLALAFGLWAQRLRHRHAPHADLALREEVAQLHARLGEVEVVQARVAEVEERVDFAERLLAQQREPGRLKG